MNTKSVKNQDVSKIRPESKKIIRLSLEPEFKIFWSDYS
jgi:hypothetical protein